MIYFNEKSHARLKNVNKQQKNNACYFSVQFTIIGAYEALISVSIETMTLTDTH